MILKHRFTLLALMTLLIASLTGCSQDEPAQHDQKKDSVILRLAIDTGLNPSSRAGEPDYFEKPSGDFENIYTIRVIIVKDGKVVEANRLVKTTDTGRPIDDNLEFKVETGSKSVYLIANEATLPVPDQFAAKDGRPAVYSNATAFLDDQYKVGNEFSPEVFQKWVVDLPGGNPAATAGLYSNIAGANGLPLTEAFDFTVSADSDPKVAQDETQTVYLFLTRAAAKATFNVEVASDYQGSGVNITGIRLNGLNWQQYVFPKDAKYDPEKNVVIKGGLPEAVTATNRYLTSFATPGRVNGVTGANVTLNLAAANQIEIKAGANGEVGPVYIPESLIPAQNAPGARFNVQVQLDNSTWLDAKELGVGTGNNIQLVNGAQAIARNTHLKVTIGFNSDNQITATVQLVPYVSVVLKPGFGFEELNPNQNN